MDTSASASAFTSHSMKQTDIVIAEIACNLYIAIETDIIQNGIMELRPSGGVLEQEFMSLLTDYKYNILKKKYGIKTKVENWLNLYDYADYDDTGLMFCKSMTEAVEYAKSIKSTDSIYIATRIHINGIVSPNAMILSYIIRMYPVEHPYLKNLMTLEKDGFPAKTCMLHRCVYYGGTCAVCSFPMNLFNHTQLKRSESDSIPTFEELYGTRHLVESVEMTKLMKDSFWFLYIQEINAFKYGLHCYDFARIQDVIPQMIMGYIYGLGPDYTRGYDDYIRQYRTMIDVGDTEILFSKEDPIYRMLSLYGYKRESFRRSERFPLEKTKYERCHELIMSKLKSLTNLTDILKKIDNRIETMKTKMEVDERNIKIGMSTPIHTTPVHLKYKGDGGGSGGSGGGNIKMTLSDYDYE